MMEHMNDAKNYYEILEIPSNARSEEIYHSYQRAKQAYSNDSLALYSLMSQEECRNILEMIDEAYSILSDPVKRKRYDEARGFNRDFSLSTSASSLRASLNALHSNAQSTYVPSSAADSQESEADKRHLESLSLSSVENFGPGPALSNGGASNPSSQVAKLVNQKRFALEYVVDDMLEKEINDALEFSGEFLKRIREYKNVDIERLADMTKVSKMHIQNIEYENFSKLPAPVYVRGFVFQYAKCLKLSTDKVANSYVARMKRAK
jgi:curved DNA-binding protein CbpA